MVIESGCEEFEDKTSHDYLPLNWLIVIIIIISIVRYPGAYVLLQCRRMSVLYPVSLLLIINTSNANCRPAILRTGAWSRDGRNWRHYSRTRPSSHQRKVGYHKLHIDLPSFRNLFTGLYVKRRTYLYFVSVFLTLKTVCSGQNVICTLYSCFLLSVDHFNFIPPFCFL